MTRHKSDRGGGELATEPAKRMFFTIDEECGPPVRPERSRPTIHARSEAGDRTLTKTPGRSPPSVFPHLPPPPPKTYRLRPVITGGYAGW